MNKYLLFILLFAWFPYLSSAQIVFPHSLMGKDLGLTGQPGWSYHTSHQGYRHIFGRDPKETVEAVIDLGATLPKGTYRVSLCCVDLDRRKTIIYTVPGDQESERTHDRDFNRHWTVGVVLTAKSSFSQLRINVSNTAAKKRAFFLRGCSITDNLGSVILSDGTIVNHLRHPTEQEYDNSPKVPGNLIPNSSFEIQPQYGLFGDDATDDFELFDAWSTNRPHTGDYSLHLWKSTYTKGLPALRSMPLRLKANKEYVASVWVYNVRSARGITLEAFNPFVPPKGFPDQVIYQTELKALAPNKWTRIRLPFRALNYPSPYYAIKITRPGSDPFDGYLDDIQLEETSLSDFEFKEQLELAVNTNHPGNVYYTNDSLVAELHVYNSGVEVTDTVWWETFDIHNASVASGSKTITFPARSLTSTNLSIDTGKMGWFRRRWWIVDYESDIDYDYMIIPPVPKEGLANPSIGTGINFDHHSAAAIRRAGLGTVRALSVGTTWKWTQVYNGPGNFKDRRSKFSHVSNHDLSQLVTLYSVPKWTLFPVATLTNVSGAFYANEIVASGKKAGKVIHVFGPTSGPGNALQMKAMHGIFLSGESVTGQTSGATATIDRTDDDSPNFAEWRRYCRYVATNAVGLATEFEIFNEPHGGSRMAFMKDSNDRLGYGFLAEHTKIAHDEISSVITNAVIVGLGGGSKKRQVDDFMAGMGEASDKVDVISGHFYAGNDHSEPGGPEHIRAFSSVVRNTYGKEFWNTESGFFDHGSRSLNAAYLNLGSSVIPYQVGHRWYKAQRVGLNKILEAATMTFGTGGKRFYYYENRISEVERIPYVKASHTTGFEHDLTWKPKMAGLIVFRHLVQDAVGHDVIPVSPKDTRAMLFSRDDTTLVSLLSVDQHLHEIDLFTNVAPGDITVLDVMGNVVSTDATSVAYGNYATYIKSTTLDLEGMIMAFTGGTVSARSDITPPNLVIAVFPRTHIQGAKPYYQWWALDDGPRPDDLASTNMLYSFKLEDVDTDWSPWHETVHAEYPAQPEGHVFFVRARDAAGNTVTQRVSNAAIP